MTARDYRPHFDGLRGLAVIAVLWFHAFPGQLKGGYLGVDVFFVISGCLISEILFREFSSPRAPLFSVLGRFYVRRVLRIFPALILVLLACLVFGYLWLVPSEFEHLASHAAASAGFFQNFALADETGYFAPAAQSQPLLHLWSLSIEEQFYLAWPLVVWAILLCRANPLPVASFLMALSYFWRLQTFQGTEDEAFFLPHMRAWELLAGAVAAGLTRSWPRMPATPTRPGSEAVLKSVLREAAPLVGLAMIAAALAANPEPGGNAMWWTFFPIFGAALIVTSDRQAWINRRVLAWPALVWVGTISYALYLWHWPLFAFAGIVSEGPLTNGLRCLLLATAVLLAWVTTRWLERPLRSHPRPGRIALALTGAMVLVAVAAVTIHFRHGYPDRFPKLLSEIASYQYDPRGPTRLGEYFLQGDQNETNFKVDPNEILPGKPTLYLWGDSHAASLYAGMASVYGGRFNIVQRTAGKTPPLLAQYFPAGGAQRINRWVLESIVRDRPSHVVLDANWEAYDWPKIEDTIAALKVAGVPHIVLVGPVPQWSGTLPQQLFNYVRKHRDQPVPVRLHQGVGRQTAAVDAKMQALAERLEVEYISPWRILGNDEGYLVRTGDTPDSLTTYDSSHLTAAAATYVVAHFPKPLAP